MSRAPASGSGRSGNPKIVGSGLSCGRVKLSQTNDFKIDGFPLPSLVLSIIRIGRGLVE